MNKKLFALLALSAFLTGCTIVDTGNIGVSTTFGKVSPTPVSQGTYLTIFESIDQFTSKEVLLPVADLKPKSKDNLTLADLDLDVYVAVSPVKVADLYVKYQGDFTRHGAIVEGSNTPTINVMGYQRVIREAREAAYKAVAEFEATTMHQQRELIAEKVRQYLQAGLDKTDKGSFVVTNVNVRQLTTDPAIERSIREQIQMDQDVAKKQKEKALATAEAERLVELAKGEAEANEILSRSLTGPVLEIRLAEIQRQTIIDSAKAGNVVIHGDATPFVGVK